MSGTTAPDQGDDPEAADGSGGDGRLVSVYRRYIGTPETRRDVYVGFGTFFAGVALGVVGLALFLYSGTQPASSAVFWQLREAALAFVMLGLPAVALSVGVLLPVGRRTVGASLLGAGVCVAGTVWLTRVYPYQWTTAGNDVTVLSTYAVGVVLLAASTGSALVAQYVDRVAPRESVDDAATPAVTDDDDEAVTDEQVAEDVADAMSDSSLTWGGVEQEPTTKRLDLNMPESPDVDESGRASATETRSSGDDVDDAVSGLRQLQGGETKTARAGSPDDQVDALTEFREARETDDVETGVEGERSLVARLRSRLFD